MTTGIVRFGARDYDPAMRRWTQKDAGAFAGGVNLFRYAKCDPVNYMTARVMDPKRFLEPPSHTRPLWAHWPLARRLARCGIGLNHQVRQVLPGARAGPTRTDPNRGRSKPLAHVFT